MNLYEKIEKLYQNNQSQNSQFSNDKLLRQILSELKEIKTLLMQNGKKIDKTDRSLMNFVREFREQLKPNVSKDIYPEVVYNGRVLGVNNKGLLYDKSTLRLLSTSEAFEVYRYFYDKHRKSV